MSHIIQSFGDWKALNEDSAPGSVTVRARMGQKVVLTPIDDKTLKIKIKNDADVLDASQKLTASGFKALVDFIKTQPTIIGFGDYPKLNDLGLNIVIYTTERDSPSTQVITFNIGSKSALGGTINSQVQYARQDELELIKKGTILNVPSALTPAAKATTELKLPILPAGIVGSTDAKLIEFIKNAYLKIKKEPLVAQNPIMATIKSEVSAVKLGEGSKIFVAGLNAGFGIKDWSGDDVETSLTQALIDKLAVVSEAESQVIAGFDPELFNAQVTLLSSSATGEIKVPTGGFKEGLKNDPEMKKVQDLILKKFAKLLSDHSAYQKFKKAGASGFVGNYGPLTTELVRLIKIGLEDPYYPNRDGSTIEAEFINRLQNDSALKESVGFYLSLNGKSLIVEGFNVAAVNAAAPSTATVTTPTGNRDTSGTVNRSSSKIRTSTALPGWEYAANSVKGIWTTREAGEGAADWRPAKNFASIKDLMKNYPNDGAYYTIPPKKEGNTVFNGIDGKQNYIYKPTSSGWQASFVGDKVKWNAPAADSIAWLDSKYGKAADLAAGKASTTTTTSTSFSGELTRTQQNKIAESIKSEFSSQLGETIEFEGGAFEGIKFEVDLLKRNEYTEYQIGIDGKVSITVPDGDYDKAYTYIGRLTSDLTGFKITNASYGSDSISWKWSDLPKKQRFRNPNGSYLTGDKLTEAIKKAQEAMSGAGTWVNQTLNQVFKCKTKADWKNFNKQWNSANTYSFPQWMIDEGNNLCISTLRILTEGGVITPADYRGNQSSNSVAKTILVKYYS